MHKKLVRVIVGSMGVGCAVLLWLPPAQGQILVNGSFESGAPITNSAGILPPIPGWTVTGQRVEIFGFEGKSDGSNAAVFDNGTGASSPASGTHSAMLSQSFATVPGTTYSVNYDYGWYSPFLGGQAQSVNVVVTGTGSLLNQTNTISSSPFTFYSTHRQAYTFTANSSTTTLSFKDVLFSPDGFNADGVLDRVEVVVQPQNNGRPMGRVIDVDFNVTGQTTGTYQDSGVAPDSGRIWNAVTPGAKNSPAPPTSHGFTASNLVGSDGTPSSVSISLTGINQYDTTVDAGGIYIDRFAGPLLDDFVYDVASTSVATFTLSGLSAGAQYDLYLYSQNGGYFSQSTTFTIGAQSLTAANSSLTDPTTNFVAGVNYVLFSGLVANGAGQITGTFGDLAGIGGTLNGFQLVEFVPEPSTALLLLVGGGWLWRARRRENS